MQAKQIFCPVDLPIQYTLGLADAHILLESWRQTRDSFSAVLDDPAKRAALPAETVRVCTEARNALYGKIEELSNAVNHAKKIYAIQHSK